MARSVKDEILTFIYALTWGGGRLFFICNHLFNLTVLESLLAFSKPNSKLQNLSLIKSISVECINIQIRASLKSAGLLFAF